MIGFKEYLTELFDAPVPYKKGLINKHFKGSGINRSTYEFKVGDSYKYQVEIVGYPLKHIFDLDYGDGSPLGYKESDSMIDIVKLKLEDYYGVPSDVLSYVISNDKNILKYTNILEKVDFLLKNFGGTSEFYGIASNDQSIPVFSTVIKILSDRYKKEGYPKIVYFSGYKTDIDIDITSKTKTGRVRLYRSLLKKFGEKLGFKIFERDDGETVVFYGVHKK